MASEKQIAANRRNAQLSTGATTAEGKARSSMNSYRHGMRSKKRKLLREDLYFFENRKHKWLANFQAADDVSEFLAYQNVCASFEVEHAVQARVERVSKLIEASDDQEIDAARELSLRLFSDRAAAPGLYGNLPDFRTKQEQKQKTSYAGVADDPDHPARLVAELEKTAQGCILMLEKWQGLRGQLEPGKVWQSADRLAAIRLLGRQPTEAATERTIALIFAACDGLNLSAKSAFEDLRSDMNEDQLKRFRRNVQKRFPDLFGIEQPDECRRLLVELTDENIERLETLVDEFQGNADEAAAATVAALKCDGSPETYRLLNYIMRARNGLKQGFATYEKYRKRLKEESNRDPLKTEEALGRMPDRSLVTGAGQRDGLDLAWAYEASAASDDAAAPPVGMEEIDPREMARVDAMLDTILLNDQNEVVDREADPGAGVTQELELESGEQPGAEPMDAGENQLCVTSEPNFDGDVLREEHEDAAHVTANSDGFLGLDTGGEDGANRCKREDRERGLESAPLGQTVLLASARERVPGFRARPLVNRNPITRNRRSGGWRSRFPDE